MAIKMAIKNPRERFLKVAEYRTNKVIQSIESLSKCSSRNYEYEDRDIRKMFRFLKNSLSECENKFKNKGKNNPQKFTF